MKVTALIKLIRLYYSLPLSAGLTVIVMYLTGPSLATLPPALPWACLALFLIIAGAYSLNDLCDITSDRINHPQRVLVRGHFSMRAAKILAIVLFLTGNLCAACCNTGYWIGLILVCAGLIVYDLTSKRLGVFKAVLVATLTSSLYPLAFTLGGLPATERARTLWFHMIWFFLTALAYEMYKDILDTKGDRTIATRASHDRQQLWYQRLAPWTVLVSTVFLIPPAVLGYCQWIYLIAVLDAIVCALVALRSSVRGAIIWLYASVVIVTLGSFLDLLVFGI
jgi:4-hydroxybenzoate polyprenyltransferase